MPSDARLEGRSVTKRLRTFAVRLLVAAGSLLNRELHAEPDELSFTWEAPSNCPQRQDVLEQIRELSRDAYPGDRRLHVRGSITELDHNRYVLELTLEAAEGSKVRRLEANACRQLAGGAAVIVGLELTRARQGKSGADAAADGTSDTTNANASNDSSTASNAGGASGKGAPGSNRAAGSSADSEPEKETSDKRAESLAEALRVRPWWLELPKGGVTLLTLPSPVFTLGASFGRRLGRWSIGLDGDYGFARSVNSTTLASAAASVQLHSAALSVAHTWRAGALVLEPGLSVGGVYLLASGSGNEIASSRARTILGQVGLNLNLSWLLTNNFALRAAVFGGIFSGRPSLVVDDLGELRRLGPGMVACSLGPQLNF